MSLPTKNSKGHEVKERPILFNGEMVRAILSDWKPKTQTRRPIDFSRKIVEPRGIVRGDFFAADTIVRSRTKAKFNRHGAVCGLAENSKWLGLKPYEFDFVTPFCEGETRLCNGKWIIVPQKGSILWVRESATVYSLENGRVKFVYEADQSFGECEIPKRITGLKVGNKMPNGCFREASRIFLKVNRVTVDRIQGISETEAWSEGCERPVLGDKNPTICGFLVHPMTGNYRDAFRALWDSIYAMRPDRSWNANPWVWCCEFERVEG